MMARMTSICRRVSMLAPVARGAGRQRNKAARDALGDRLDLALAPALPPVDAGAEDAFGHVDDEQDEEQSVDHLVEGERGVAEQALEGRRALDGDAQRL